MGKAIYLELDSLVDTRLALLYSLSEKTAIEVLPDYHLRRNDIFGNIPYRLFEELYKLRKKNILEFAIPTKILDILGMMVAEKRGDVRNIGDKYKLYLNTYPYVLTKEEQDRFSEVITRFIPDLFVECIYETQYSLTPKFITDKDISDIIMYNGLEWLEKQISLFNIVEHPLINRSLVVPAITNEFGIKVDKNLFLDTAKRLEMVITVIFVDVAYFAPMLPTKKDK